ncbi:aminotransferase class I/II-fold pyridoxal phosphate-dependent enzyme [Lacinutrix salivirga]
MLPKKLQQKLDNRKAENSLRSLPLQNNLVDFSSNDYLGFSKNITIFNAAHKYVVSNNMAQNGATGSRLLSGNHSLYTSLETTLSSFYNSESALVFNSGYDANIGFFQAVPQRGDIILFDEYIHASIRDGIKMSDAKGYKFAHNNLKDLEQLLTRYIQQDLNSHNQIYVVTESVFSMDGDSPDLKTLSELCKKHKTLLIIDEAHAIGVFGTLGCGLVQDLGLENAVFARIITFGKAIGCHGAAILCSEQLKQYLVNFCRSFIYTTGLSPHAIASVIQAYNQFFVLQNLQQNPIQELHNNISFFKSEVLRLHLNKHFIPSHSAIHCCIVSGNATVKFISEQFQQKTFSVKAILSPTVPKGKERLRFCLHSYNSQTEITKVLELLSTFVTNE